MSTTRFARNRMKKLITHVIATLIATLVLFSSLTAMPA